MIRTLLLFLLLVACILPQASAQSRDVYTIRGISVDERAASVIEAREAAFNRARLIGARQMIARITLAEDRVNAPGLAIDQQTANLLAAAVDVEEEIAGAGRYRGRLAVVFNPTNVRAFLDQAGIAYNDQQAPLAVVIPVASGVMETFWNSAWNDRSEGRLAPTVTSRSSGYSEYDDWEAIEGEVALYGVKRGVLAHLRGSDGAYRVDVSLVTPSGVREIGTTPYAATLEQAVSSTHDLLDQEWKNSSVVRDGTRTLIEATVLYTSLAEWNTLRGALARSPLVSEFQTKAVSVDGAVVAFVFAGDGTRLTTDLRDRGVVITAQPIGWVMTSAVTAGR